MKNTNHLIYLEIHNTKDGMKTFNCGTRYDWYLIKKSSGNATNQINNKNKYSFLLLYKQLSDLPYSI